MPVELDADLDSRVAAFEACLRSDPAADLAAHLPPREHPHHLPVLTELVRVDLERGWAAGRPRRLPEYQRRFPTAFADSEFVRQAAFEEFRQRRLAGEAISPSEYRAEYGIDTSDWAEPDAVRSAVWPARDVTSTPAPLGASSVLADFHLPASASPLSSYSIPRTDQIRVIVPDVHRLSTRPSPGEAGERFPEAGSTFLGFHLQEELGRGTFSRVFLARQADLSGRPVALKVATDIVDESRTLAQLQHANIVPIYSYHKAGTLQAACMPYHGRNTLAHLLHGLASRDALPSSGRELKSTVNQRAGSTVRLIPASAPAPEQDAPASTPSDGWVKLDGLSYVEAVLWIGEQLADGLAHAHAHGILHQDLKPANVLLTDDGRPMLLDFNLSEDTKRRGDGPPPRIGGTLPYMAPEQMRAFAAGRGGLDGRCDVYALGVILFELLTGRHPFPIHRGQPTETVPLLLADRLAPLASAAGFNPAVSPAVDALIRTCLAPNPERRYQSAEQLRDDLHRHLSHQPLRHAPNPSVNERLRKWAKRHPKLTSSASVGAAAAVLLIGVGGAAAAVREQARTDRARVVLADHRTAFADARLLHDDRHLSLPRLDAALDSYRRVLAGYGVPDDGTDDGWLTAESFTRLPECDREAVRPDVGELFYMMAQTAMQQARTAAAPAARDERLATAAGWHAAAARHAVARLPRSLRQQKADLGELTGDPAAAATAMMVETTAPGSARDQVLLGTRFARAGHLSAAAAFLTAATRLDPTSQSGWFVRGTVHLDLGQPEAASECFAACVSLRPGFAPAWLNRGLAYEKAGRHAAARAEYDKALELDPSLTAAYLERAFVKDALGDAAGAVADYDQAISAGTAGPRAHFLRATARRKLGDAAGADADTAAGLAAPPGDDPLDWVARSEVRLVGLPAVAAAVGGFAVRPVQAAALADVTEALALDPDHRFALQQLAHVQSEHFDRPAESRAALDRLVQAHPDAADARVDRGVLLARTGDRAAAVRDAEAALLIDAKPPTQYQAACVYSQTSRTHPDDRREARRLLWAALRTGYGLDWVDTDSDLDPLRNDPLFQSLVRDARALHAPR